MSNSNPFYPEEVVGSVRHVLKPVSEWKKKVLDKSNGAIDVSAPVRFGPLEFRIAARFFGVWKLAVQLQCNNVCTNVPWRGTVVAQFRILDETGRKELKYPASLAVSKSYSVSSEKELAGEPNTFEFNDDFCIKDSVFLEFLLKLNLNIGLDEETKNLGWKIPYAILNAAVKSFPDQDSGDLSIVSKDGDRLAAHSFILEWSSPVFKTMLSTEMREKAEGTINMKFGSKAVKILIKFLYTGGFKEEMEDLVEYDVEDFLEVVNAGGMYELPLLMKLAGVALLLRCRKENVWDLFARLKTYGESMKETMLSLADFVQRNVHAMAIE